MARAIPNNISSEVVNGCTTDTSSYLISFDSLTNSITQSLAIAVSCHSYSLVFALFDPLDFLTLLLATLAFICRMIFCPIFLPLKVGTSDLRLWFTQ